MPGHLHLRVEVDPQFEVHRRVRAVNVRSSRVLCEEFRRLRARLASLWTNSYFFATSVVQRCW